MSVVIAIIAAIVVLILVVYCVLTTQTPYNKYLEDNEQWEYILRLTNKKKK